MERKAIPMKKLVAVTLVILSLVGLMIPAFAGAEYVQTTPMWVNCANGKTLNVRDYPSTSGSLLYRLECGTRVEIINTVPAPKGWAYVEPDGYSNGGYVMTKFLVSKQPQKYEITEREDNFRAVTPYYVTAKALSRRTDSSVGLRVQPNKTAREIRRLIAGDMLQVIARGKTWSQVIDLTTGQTGYMANDYMVRQ